MALGGILGAVGGGTVGKAVVEVIGESSKLRSDLAKAKGDSAKATGAMGKDTQKFSGMAKAAYLAIGAAVVGFAATSVKAFLEAQKVTAQTEAVLKSTGGQANVTKDDVLNLASGLRDLSGVEDETIQSGINMLLTFREIRNEVGAGNDVFDQATEATLNLSVAMGKDMQSSAILVGKALNDPIGGLTALKKAGIQFTESQKETIKSLVEAGDVMGAQKIVLKELETQFGGSAKAAGETFAGQLKILKSQFGDIQESVGKFIVSGLTPLVSGFVNLPGPIKAAAIAIVGLTTVLVAVGFVVRMVKSSLDALGVSAAVAGARTGGFGAALVGVLGKLGPVAIGIGLVIAAGEGLQGLINKLTNTISTEEALVRVTTAMQQAVASGNYTWAQITAMVDEYNRTIGSLPGAEKLTMDAIRGTAGAAGELAGAYEEGASAAEDLLAAQLALAGGFVGIASAIDGAADSERELAEARAEVARLTREGKTGTDEYAAAVEAVDDAARGSLSSQLSLAGAVEKFAEEASKTGDVQGAIDRVRDFGVKAGLTKGEINKLVGQVRDAIGAIEDMPGSKRVDFSTPGLSGMVNDVQRLKDKLNAIPSTVTTRFVIMGDEVNPRPGGRLALGGIIPGQAGFITKGPTMLVGESRRSTFAGRGAEAVIPFDNRGIGILAKALEKAGGQTASVDAGNYLAIHFNAPIYGMRDFKQQVVRALEEASSRFGAV
jgi:hypothetical protein